MGLKAMRAAALKAAQDIINGAKASSRELTADEVTTIEAKHAEIADLDLKIKAADQANAAIKAIGDLGPNEEVNQAVVGQVVAKSIGEWFVKHAGARLQEIKGVRGASATAPDYKAATTTHTSGAAFADALTDIDRTIVQAPRPRLVVADLLGSGTLSGNAITYFVEGIREGNFATVAEGGAKPQIHYVDPTAVTDNLKKIAGFIKLSDEMLEDLDFLVSEINLRLLYDLGVFEEVQLLSGNGTGTNLLGLLNRSGVQTEVAADNTDNADAIFRAITKVATGSGLTADGLVINPLDYQKLRLGKDANGQYHGGGYFQGQYGNGVLLENPPVWGLRTVVTPAIAAGAPLVGSYAQAATLYRKGGVRVESTNTHDDDFTNNLVTIRAEERVALAVRRPAAFVKVTLSSTAPVTP